jgi:hypothetical protein
MERPNTVAGLINKRRELVAKLKLAEADAKALTVGIDALDVVLKLFAPDVDGAAAKPMRLPTYHAASKGEMQRAALDLLRQTGAPITSRMVAQRFCQARGLTPDDATFTNIRNRASNALCHMRDKGIIQPVGRDKANVCWGLV